MFSIAVIALCLTVVAAGPQWMARQPSIEANEVKDSALKFEPAQIFQEFEKVWEDFKSKHSKSYEDKEEVVRKDVFKTNLKRIELHNYLHSKGEKSFTVGTNEYSDMKHSEFVSVMNGYKTPASNTTRRGMTYMSPNVPVTLPDTKDWRTEGYVTPVKNQGHCGSCWSFSTTGSLEGQHFRRSQKLVSLSEQNLVDCSAKWGNNGCNGGLMDNAFQYIEDNDGIDTEESYPYKAKQGKCHFKSRDIGATDLGFTDTPEGDEDKLKEALATVGPISIAIDASHPSFQMYKEGVYDEPECSSTALDHGVLIVGYGTSEEGADYWLVKNSWGPTWGLDGYIKMSRNKENQCGVASKASYPNV